MIFKFIEALQRVLLPSALNEATLVRDDFIASKHVIADVAAAVPGILDVVIFTLEYINSTKLSKPVRRLEAAVIRGVLKKPTEGPMYKALLEREQTENDKLHEALQGILNLAYAYAPEDFNLLKRDVRLCVGSLGILRAIREALANDVFSEERKASLRRALEENKPIEAVVLKQVSSMAQRHANTSLLETVYAFEQGLMQAIILEEPQKYLMQARDMCSSDPAIKALLEMEAAEREKEYMGIKTVLSAANRMFDECPNWRLLLRTEYLQAQEVESLQLGQIKIILATFARVETEMFLASKMLGTLSALKEGLIHHVFSDKIAKHLQQRLIDKKRIDDVAVEQIQSEIQLDRTVLEAIVAFKADLLEGNVSELKKACLQTILDTRPSDKDTQVETITGIIDWVSDAAEQDFLSPLIRKRLGEPKTEGVPYPIGKHDAAQEVQAKKILGALHHGWKALEASEASELTKWVTSYQQPWQAPKAWGVSYYTSLQNTFNSAALKQGMMATRQWGKGLFIESMLQLGKLLFIQNMEEVPQGLWNATGDLVFKQAIKGLTFLAQQTVPSAFRVGEILDERHRAFNAIIQVEGALFEPFKDELAYAMAYGKTCTFEIDDKEAFALAGTNKVGLGLTFLVDQLRTKKTGGADPSLIVEALLGLFHYASQITTEIQDYLSETKPVGSASVIAGFGASVADGFQHEVRDRSADEKKRLKKLNQTASNILAVFTKNTSSWSGLSNLVRLAWYGWSLFSDVQQSTLALSDAGHEGMRVTLLEQSARVGRFIGFLHKFEASFALKRGLFSDPMLAFLQRHYQTLTGYTSFVVATENLNLLHGATFNKARQAVLKEQCKEHRIRLEYINDVLFPALDYITGYKKYPGPAADLPRLFQALQRYVEAVNPALSNGMVARIKKGEALSHEDFSPYYQEIKAGLIRAKKTEQFSLASIHGLINHHILAESTQRKKERGASLLLRRDKTHRVRNAAAIQEAVFAWRRLARDVKAYYGHIDIKTINARPKGMDGVYHKRMMNRIFQHIHGLSQGDTPRAFLSLPACYPQILMPASDRRLGNYLLLNNGQDSNVEAMHAWVKRTRALIQQVIDPEGNKVSSLSLTNVVGMFDSLDRLFEAARNMKEDSVLSAATTIFLFDSLIRIVIQAYPYAQALQEAYTDVHHDMYISKEKHQAYYQPKYQEDEHAEPKEDPDWVFHVMNVLLIAPLHMKALVAEASFLPQDDVRAAHKKARAFSLEVNRLISLNAKAKKHYDDYALRFVLSKPDAIFYMLCAGDGLAFGLRRVFGCSETLDQEFMRAFQVFSKALYQTTTKHGLQAYNRNVAYPLRKRTAYLEQALCVKPGTTLELVEKVLRAFRSGFVEYLSLESKVFDREMRDEDSLKSLITDMVDRGGKSHVTYLNSRQKQEKLRGELKEAVRVQGVKRFIRLDFLRTENTLALKYTHALYADALKAYLTPAIQDTIRQEDKAGNFDERVFGLIHQPLVNHDLALLHDTPERPSLRLARIQTWIEQLDAYLTTSEMSYYENEATLFRKRVWVDMLRDISENPDLNLKPSERIEIIRALLHEASLKRDLEAYAPINGVLEACKRVMLWFLACVGLHQQPNLDAYHALMWTAKSQTLEVEIFDAQHAKDYRQLEAIAEKLTVLEACLTSQDDVSEMKRSWLLVIRSKIEDNVPTPRARIEAVQALMEEENFKLDMLAYTSVERWTYQAFRQQVMHLLEYVGVYGRPCAREYYKMIQAALPETQYSHASLFTLFSEPVSTDTRPYKTSDVLNAFNLTSNLTSNLKLNA
jgi:hypothetical protein